MKNKINHMRIKIYAFLYLQMLSAVFFYDCAFADLVLLKNGQNIEGIVEDESSETCTVNIGSGKVILQKIDIYKIEKYSFRDQSKLREKWKSEHFRQPEYIPQSLKSMIESFEKLEDLRSEAIKNKKNKDLAKNEIDKYEKEITELNDDLTEASQKLSIFRPEDNMNDYNVLVKKFNSLQAKIKFRENKKDVLVKSTQILNKNIANYINELIFFSRRLEQEYVFKKHETDELYLLEKVQNAINKMKDDFTTHTVSFTGSSSNIMVNVLINDLVRANFVLDTGASLVVISRDIANKLGIGIRREESSIFITLADGRKVSANIVTIKSLRIGRIEGKDIEAAVLDYEENSDLEGLLGMSFLKQFMINIDAKNGKLIIEEFTP